MNVQINAQFCKGCGFCVRFCPENALAMGMRRNKKGNYLPEFDQARCIASNSCTVCAKICPEGAITIQEEVRAA